MMCDYNQKNSLYSVTIIFRVQCYSMLSMNFLFFFLFNRWFCLQISHKLVKISREFRLEPDNNVDITSQQQHVNTGSIFFFLHLNFHVPIVLLQLGGGSLRFTLSSKFSPQKKNNFYYYLVNSF